MELLICISGVLVFAFLLAWAILSPKVGLFFFPTLICMIIYLSIAGKWSSSFEWNDLIIAILIASNLITGYCCFILLMDIINIREKIKIQINEFYKFACDLLL